MRLCRRRQLVNLLVSGSLVLSVLLGFIVLAAPPAIAQDPQPPHGSGQSEPPIEVNLRELPPSSPSNDNPGPVPVGRAVSEQEYERQKDDARTALLPSEQRTTPGPGGVPPSVPQATSPTLLASFAALSDTGWSPPDGAIAVGPNQILAAVNSSFQVFTKTGVSLLSPKSFANLYASFGFPSGTSAFDPRAVYDHDSGRWLLLTAVLNTEKKLSYLMISTSKSEDATSSWCTYRLNATLDGSIQTENWADYPSIGLDHQAVYLTANMFSWTDGFQYSKLRILNKSQLAACSSVDYYDIWGMTNVTGSAAFTLQPALTFGTPGTEYLVNSGAGSANYLNVWTLTNPLSSRDWSHATITVASYSVSPDAPQSDSTTPLDTGDPRIMSLAYRDGSLWATHTTAYDWGSGNVAAVRWYEIDPISLNLKQWGTYGADGMHYFYPSAMPSDNGLGMVVDVSASSLYAGVRYAGRANSDPGGAISTPGMLEDGKGMYVMLDPNGKDRWGDYSATAFDPLDGTVWMLGEYAAGSNRWGTWIGQLSVPAPSPTRTPTPTYTPTMTNTVTPTPTYTASPTPTATSTPIPTSTPTVSPAATPTPTPVAIPTPTPTPGVAPGPAPIVMGIDPRTGSGNSATTVMVQGTNFRGGASVRLERAGVIYTLTNVTVVGSTVAVAQAPAGMAPGVYDVVMINSDGTAGRLPGAFTVSPALPGSLRVYIPAVSRNQAVGW